MVDYLFDHLSASCVNPSVCQHILQRFLSDMQGIEPQDESEAEEEAGTVMQVQRSILEGPVSTAHPEIFKVKWKLKDFSTWTDKSYNSPVFEIADVKWSILFHPKVLKLK